MKVMRFRAFILAAVAAFQLSSSRGICQSLLQPGGMQLRLGNSVSAADRGPWDDLRKKVLLINQDFVAGRKNLCVAASTINVLQAAAAEFGLKPIVNPGAVLTDFVRKHVKGDAGMDMADAIGAIKTIFNSTFPGKAATVKGLELKNLKTPRRPEITDVQSFNLSDLAPDHGRFKIVFFAVFDINGKLIGEHANIVADIWQNQLRLIDPIDPYKELVVQQSGSSDLNGQNVPSFTYVAAKRIVNAATVAPFGVITIDVSNRI